MRQAIGKLQFFDVSSCWGIPTCRVLLYPKLLSNYNRDAPVLCQARGQLQFEMFCFAPSYWGITIVRLLSCVKLFRNYNLYGFAVRQALVELYFARFCFARVRDYNFEVPVLCQAVGAFQYAGFCFTSGHWGLTICKVLFCPKLVGDYNVQGRFRCVIVLEHAKSVFDCGSSYIFIAPLHHTSFTRPLLGDSGSS